MLLPAHIPDTIVNNLRAQENNVKYLNLVTKHLYWNTENVSECNF